ncbi:MAG: siroheme synthase, N-terminal domain [Acidimicrobiales bacterium]|nr:siroheme synthase, N-terminal domain [Acidimicrobiales bacterium]
MSCVRPVVRPSIGRSLDDVSNDEPEQAAAPRLPVMLDLREARCLVVGCGAVGLRKARDLLAAGADVTAVAPGADPGLASLADSGTLEWRRRAYREGEAAAGPPWRFVVAATHDPALNGRIVDDAMAVGIWANDTTDARGGPAALAAVHRQGPITLAVSTGGSAPAAAAWLRDELAASIGPEHATLVAVLAEVRAEARKTGRSTASTDWRGVLDSGMLDLIRHGRIAEAKERLQACLSSSSD